MAKLLKSGGNVLLLDEPTNDLDVETLRALEDALEDFAGCAVVISPRPHLPRPPLHPHPRLRGRGHVEWFEGNFEDYEEDKKRRLGPDALEPKRVKYKNFGRPCRCGRPLCGVHGISVPLATNPLLPHITPATVTALDTLSPLPGRQPRSA
jgi:hypothetical protein